MDQPRDHTTRPGLVPVDIVVPVHNQVEMTGRFLESLKAFTEHPYRLFMVDNGSTDLPETMVMGFRGARLIKSPKNLGFAAGCNMGIRSGSNPLVAVLNNDLILTPCWLGRLVRALSSAPDIAAAAPCTNYSAGFQQVSIGAFGNDEEMRARAEAFSAKYRRQIEDVPFITGMCFLVKREVLDRTGLFDERFGIGNYEDNDLCVRIKELGLRIVVARDVFIHHLGSRTFQTLGSSYGKLLEKNKGIFFEKWIDSPYVQGRRLEEQGEIKGAMECYLAALKSGSPNPEPLLQLGAILLGIRRFGPAARAFTQYLERCPESTRGRLGLGCALSAGGQTREGGKMIDGILAGRYVRQEERETIRRLLDEFTLTCSEA